MTTIAGATRPLPSFAELRMLARTSPVTRACIDLRAQQVAASEWDIVTPDEWQPLIRRLPRGAVELSAMRRREAVRFFRRPDPNYGPAHSWLYVLAREVLETDSLSLYVMRSNEPGKGLLGSHIAGLHLLDGAHIAPGNADGSLIQTTGTVHRCLAAEVGDGPRETTGESVSRYGSRDMLYRPMRAPVIDDDLPVRRREPFGRSPAEDALTYAEDGSIDLPATEAAMPGAFGLSLLSLGMDGSGDEAEFALDQQVRDHLKGIFNFVLHNLCGAADLEWKWDGDD